METDIHELIYQSMIAIYKNSGVETLPDDFDVDLFELWVGHNSFTSMAMGFTMAKYDLTLDEVEAGSYLTDREFAEQYFKEEDWL